MTERHLTGSSPYLLIGKHFLGSLMPEIHACANLYSCKISNNTRQAALGIHIVNQHNVSVHMCAHTLTHRHTLTLNHNHSCGERESERSTVAKSQNALHFSLCDINQFFPTRHNLPRGWFQSKRHEGFPQKTPVYQFVSSFLQSVATRWKYN